MEINGTKAADWRWFEKFLGITMQTSDFYADQSGSSPVPIMEVDTLTPFGEYIGTSNSTWSDWQARLTHRSQRLA